MPLQDHTRTTDRRQLQGLLQTQRRITSLPVAAFGYHLYWRVTHVWWILPVLVTPLLHELPIVSSSLLHKHFSYVQVFVSADRWT